MALQNNYMYYVGPTFYVCPKHTKGTLEQSHLLHVLPVPVRIAWPHLSLAHITPKGKDTLCIELGASPQEPESELTFRS